MKKPALAAIAILLSLTACKENKDTHDEAGQAHVIARSAVALGATQADWKFGHEIEITVGSLLPGDARTMASLVCFYGEGKFEWRSSWTVNVFLPMGSRPAASCTIRKGNRVLVTEAPAMPPLSHPYVPSVEAPTAIPVPAKKPIPAYELTPNPEFEAMLWKLRHPNEKVK